MSLESGISRTSLRRILATHKWYPYKLQLLPHLNEDDPDRRTEFAEWAKQKLEQDPQFTQKILFSDEANFYVNGEVNKQNHHYWSDTNPHWIDPSKTVGTKKLMALSPQSRAALSLLGYCYYHIQDFSSAADSYEQLVQIHPEAEDYKLYYAKSLYKACNYTEAMKATFLLDNPAYQSKVLKLQAAIKYGEEDLSGTKSLVEQLPSDDPDSEINLGCLLYKEAAYEEASKKFISAMQVLGYQPDLAYNIALCYYSMKQFMPALKYVSDIIEHGIREHPELSVGMTTDCIDVNSVGNTHVLRETALIEAFNLKAAIKFHLKNYHGAQVAMTDMPPRSEEELDPVTLHNQALMNMDSKPTEGFGKLQFLLQQNPFPPETFGNLLLLYCKYEYFDLAADVLAENAHLTYKLLSPYLFSFLDASITCQRAPEEAYRKFDEMASELTDQLHLLTKQVQEAKNKWEDDVIKRAINEYDEVLDKYIPVLLAQAKIYWNMENYQAMENIFSKSYNFCQDNDVWKLNVAHVLFMQKNKYKDAINFYEPIVKKHYDKILSISAVILANLFVSYIMTNQNDKAEELMRKIEKEEQQISYNDPEKKIYHLCIVNLVIGPEGDPLACICKKMGKRRLPLETKCSPSAQDDSVTLLWLQDCMEIMRAAMLESLDATRRHHQ
ncbi:TT30A protein, partial [Polypterus senegalus]